MAGPDDLNDRLLGGDPDPGRENAEAKKAGGSSGAAGHIIRGRKFPDRKLELSFFEYRPVLVRRVEVEGGLSEAEQITRIAKAMGVRGWEKMAWTEVAEEQPDAPLAEVVELPTVSKGWSDPWPQPSVRLLDMERDEPRLFRALKALRDRRWLFPFSKHDSE